MYVYLIGLSAHVTFGTPLDQLIGFPTLSQRRTTVWRRRTASDMLSGYGTATQVSNILYKCDDISGTHRVLSFYKSVELCICMVSSSLDQSFSYTIKCRICQSTRKSSSQLTTLVSRRVFIVTLLFVVRQFSKYKMRPRSLQTRRLLINER